MVADGTIGLTDPLQDHLDWGVTVPRRGDHQIRLINLATHTSGLPREVEREPGPPDDPFSTLTQEAYAQALAADPLLFTPGSGALYSNFGYDLLGAALGDAAGMPYAQALQERVLEPLGLSDTKLELAPGDEDRLMQGHDFFGDPLPHVPTTPIMAGASALYSSTNDMLKWLERHMTNLTVQHARNSEPHSNGSSASEAEIRLIDHAAYVFRDQLDPVSGLDESGHMDAMALGWVIMTADQGRPLILQKAGGLQGIFVYSAFSPAKKIGVFVAINEFDFSAAQHMATVVNEMIATIAPR
jgi:D-alanyl-D-alanine-carboxypeptidase/D-alanyl-D-alanine-endopeptidase